MATAQVIAFNESIKFINEIGIKNIENHEEELIRCATILYNFCKEVFPLKFFDILYQNEDMFTNKDNDLTFLPGVDFRLLWKTNISENTRNTI